MSDGRNHISLVFVQNLNNQIVTFKKRRIVSKKYIYLLWIQNSVKLYVNYIVVLLLLMFAISYLHMPLILAQTEDTQDPTQLREEFKKGLESIQNDIKIEFDQLLAEIENETDLRSIESHLSLASLHNVHGETTEAISELQKADEAWQNSSLTSMNIGNKFISVAKDNSTLLTNGERVILDHFGKVILKLGSDIESLRIKLNR